jgi:hypothetical protein
VSECARTVARVFNSVGKDRGRKEGYTRELSALTPPTVVAQGGAHIAALHALNCIVAFTY